MARWVARIFFGAETRPLDRCLLRLKPAAQAQTPLAISGSCSCFFFFFVVVVVAALLASGHAAGDGLSAASTSAVVVLVAMLVLLLVLRLLVALNAEANARLRLRPVLRDLPASRRLIKAYGPSNATESSSILQDQSIVAAVGHMPSTSDCGSHAANQRAQSLWGQ